MGFDWVWLLSVWQTGWQGNRFHAVTTNGERNSRRLCRTSGKRTLPVPVLPSPATRCTAALGGDPALARLRERLRKRGLRLMLDFVPNHTGLDHPWVEDHPEYYIPGTELDLTRAPMNYTWVKAQARRFASGSWTRSILSGLAGHPAAQLRQPGHAGSDDRRTCKDRRAM